jgi:hypothetical protein
MQNMWTGRIDLNLLECSRTRWENIRVECICQVWDRPDVKGEEGCCIDGAT